MKELEELILWARLKFKQAKPRSLVLKKNQEIIFKIRYEKISIVNKPVKSLGEGFNCRLYGTGEVPSSRGMDDHS